MKVVYVYPQFAHAAGTERILIEKMNYLAEVYGNDVVMLTYEQGYHPVAFPLSPKVQHVDLDVRYYPLYQYNKIRRFYQWRKLEKLLQSRFNDFMSSYRPDIIISTTYYAEVLGLIVKCPVSCVRVLESHIDRRFILSNDPVNRRSLLRWAHMRYHMSLLTYRARKLDLLVALNQEDAKDWSRFLRTKVITNVVHLNSSGRVASQDNKRVIFVGRYTEQKGIPDLFKIWQLVHSKYPDWYLDLFGEGELLNDISAEAERLNMNIHIHQSDHHIFDRYMESSIFVLTSLYEPFGLVMPEAMSCGLPVVSFDCPTGPADIITDGVDGYLIQKRDIQLFAEKLCLLIESPDLRKKMGAAAIVSSQRFSAEKIMSKWENLFEELYIQHHNR